MKWLVIGSIGLPMPDIFGRLQQGGLPHLNSSNSAKTSDAKKAYNCIAWAAGDTFRWWWPIRRPGVNYWPKAPRLETIEAFIAAFETLGYRKCNDGAKEEGIEKVVLYAKLHRGTLIPTHAARQLDAGQWTSKLGIHEDVRHDTVNDVAGPAYGEPVCYLGRPRPSTNI